jgi:hypothetical protein
MKRSLVVALGIAMLVAAAAPVGAKTPKPPKNVVVLTNDQIKTDALLALTDMPTGYAADLTDLATNSQPNGTTGLCNGPNGVARAQAQSAVGIGDSDFAQNPSFGPFLGEGVYSFPSAKQAAAFVDATRSQMSCGTYNASPNGAAIKYTISQIAYTKVGDDTLALRQTSASAEPGSTGVSGSADQITVRLANNVILIAYGGLGGPNATLEQQYVGKALSKLGVAIAVAKQAAKKTKKK